MIAAETLSSGFLAAAEAKQQTEYGNQEKSQDGKPPGEAPFIPKNPGAVAFGTAVDTGVQRCVLHGNTI